MGQAGMALWPRDSPSGGYSPELGIVCSWGGYPRPLIEARRTHAKRPVNANTPTNKYLHDYCDFARSRFSPQALKNIPLRKKFARMEIAGRPLSRNHPPPESKIGLLSSISPLIPIRGENTVCTQIVNIVTVKPKFGRRAHCSGER